MICGFVRQPVRAVYTGKKPCGRVMNGRVTNVHPCAIVEDKEESFSI